MVLPRLKAAACVAILGGLGLCSPARVDAQAPPGPLPPTHPLPPPPPAPPVKKKPEIPPRKTLAGYWKLNTDESDDPKQRIADAKRPNGGPGGGMGGPRVGIGYPPYPDPNGGPNGPYGGPSRGGASGENAERIREFVHPDYSQTIVLTEAEVDSTNDQDDKQVFYPDGRKLQKSKDSAVQQVSAHWDGPKLVTDEKGPQGKKASRTFELSPDGKQLFETWHIETGRSNSSIEIRYVYDAARDQHLE